MRDYNDTKNTNFYKELNQVLRTQLPIVKEELASTLTKQKKAHSFNAPLSFISEFEKISHNIKWVLEIDFNEYEWSSKTIRPHYLGVNFCLEQVNKRVVFNYGIFNSFNETLEIRKPEEFVFETLNDETFVIRKLEEIGQFLGR